MLFKNKEVVLTNSTVKIFTVAQDVLRFIANKIPFEVIHATISLRDLNRDDDCKRAVVDLAVSFSKTILNFNISMLFKKDDQAWYLANPEIIFSHTEDNASALIANKDGSYKPSSDYCTKHIEEIQKMIAK